MAEAEFDFLDMTGKNFECGCNWNSVPYFIGGVIEAGSNVQLRFCDDHRIDPVVITLCGLLRIQPFGSGGN